MTEDLLLNILIGKKLNTSQLPSANEIASYEAAHPQIFAGRETGRWTRSSTRFPRTLRSTPSWGLQRPFPRSLKF